MDDDMEMTPKAVLQPRKPGENLKVAKVVLRRRELNLKAAADRAAQFAKLRRQRKEYKKGALNLISPEKLVKQSLTKRRDHIRQKNVFKKKKPNAAKCSSKVLAVVHNGRAVAGAEIKKTMRQLGLKKHQVQFYANNDDVLRKLWVLKPWVFWGPPKFKTIFNLIHKKMCWKDPAKPKERIPLSDNSMIETALGDLGIICTEDLAHTLHTGSKHFDKVRERLWPVQLDDHRKANGMIRAKYYAKGDIGKDINVRLEKVIGE
mmetsp:Transcript_81042/g.229471  ORF Transcript_81042/g.229471 Transcript_81042/m.229471 type:complete len:261 (-) Transcript_81042:57-839(-)